MATTKKQKVAPVAQLPGLQAADEQAKQALDRALKSYDELVAASKANLDALLQANTAAYNGAKQLNDEIVAYAKARHEANIAASKALSAALKL